MGTEEKILNEIKVITNKYEEKYRETGTCFNIFSVANIESSEVIICRIIKELINPKGAHFQGTAFLELFMKIVLELREFDNYELDNAIIEREKYISDKRRIDLFIEIGKYRIPIEVKIYANDQPLQCYDYYKYVRNSKLFYLTLFGTEPSINSLGELAPESVKIISFENDIVDWLEECLILSNDRCLTPISVIIRQLIDTLRKLTNRSEDKMEKEILEVIMESKENFKSARKIMGALKRGEDALYNKYYKSLSECIGHKYLSVMPKEDIINHYDKDGLYFVVKKLSDGNRLCLNVRSDGFIWAGFDVIDEDDNQIAIEGYLSNDDIIDGEWKSDKWWIAWEYIGTVKEKRPNFKTYNEAFYSLLEEGGLEKFVTESMKTIDKLMSSLKNSD